MAPEAHIFMPVQTGFGSPDLDFIVSVRGYALRIETKVDGKKPTARQMRTIADLHKAQVPTLIIDQHNLIDVAIVVECLSIGKHADAFNYSTDQRAEYIA